MKYKISGEIAQSATLLFEDNDTAWAANGSLMSYADGVAWSLRVPGGLGGAVKRSFAGEGLSLTYIEGRQPNVQAQLTANQPGKIIPWELATDGPVIATRGAFLCAWGPDIDIDVTIARRAGAAFFGGAGLFLQRISGNGIVLVHGSGDFTKVKLPAGRSMTVSTGNLAAFSADVDYDIRGVGGCRKALFSGEGLFVTRLTGPGTVLLQTLKRIIKSNNST
ncbi:MAG: AIM24 family protein [Chloroflexota bacterium]